VVPTDAGATTQSIIALNAVLESSKKGVLEATKGLSEAQWNFKAAPDKWSIAECMEHIAAAEDYIRGMVVEKVMKAPSTISALVALKTAEYRRAKPS
jgi:hypothetical protein